MKSFFRLDIVEGFDPAELDVSMYRCAYFETLEQAERCIADIAKIGEAVFCFYVSEYEFSKVKNCYSSCLTKRLYDKDGRLLDCRLFPEGEWGAFHGRSKEQIRFNVGDEVYYLNLHEKRLERAMAMQTPLTDEEVVKRGLELDDTDDSYTLISELGRIDNLTDEEYMIHHTHKDALLMYSKEYVKQLCAD